jgi:serine/threonine-protein kinase
VNIHVEGRDGLTEAAMRRVGTILNGKWRLDALLGLGGTAAVFAATHRNGNRVAIKLLHAHFSLDDAIRTRLQQEGYVANLIDHPGAVRILDDDRAEDGAVFLVMELLAGEGLDARLKRKGWRLPRAEALGITFSLLDVMAAAHARGVIHRDIKPDNIFVTREGSIKVLDFGIARLLDSPGNLHHTRNGALFGTLGFMAPEQALGRTHEVDARTDLWAVGATLFTLLTGRLVHEAPTPNEQLVNAATRVAPPLASVLPDADPALCALVDRALAFHQVDRFQNALEMQEAVRAIALDTLGPMGVPVLQGPRLSVEVDVGAVNEVRLGPWGSSLRPSPAPSMLRPPVAPTMVLQRGHRTSRTLVVATALGAVVLAGALLRRGRALPSDEGLAETTTAAPKNALAGTQQAPNLGTLEDRQARAAREVTALAAVAPPPAAVPGQAREESDAIDPVKPRRRLMRRAVRNVPNGAAVTAPASTLAAPQSITDNDALWGKRY